MIKNLIFDFGKVLVDYDYSILLNKFFDDSAEKARFAEAILCKEFVDKVDKGETSFLDLVYEAQKMFPMWKEQIMYFYEGQIDLITGEMPGMRELLVRLKGLGFRLYGLTNWSAVVYDVMEKFPILKMMDDRLISSEEKLIKPDPAIYRRLFEKFNLVPQECLFTDDKVANVEAAIAEGMEAVVFQNTAQYEAELVRRGLIPADSVR